MDKNIQKNKPKKTYNCSLWFWHIHGHQSWYELLGPEQGYDHTKFERPPINSICQKANIKVFVKSGNMSIISLEYVQKWKKLWYSHYLLNLLNSSTKFELNLDKNTTFLVKTIQHCCDLEIWSRSLKVAWIGKPHWVVPSCIIQRIPSSCKLWYRSQFTVSE